MSRVQVKYDTSQNFTITLASLATATARESNSVDNTSSVYIDVLVQVQVKLQSGSPVSGINVFAYGSEDGTNYGDNATGSDAALTMRSPTNLAFLGVVNTPTSGALTYKSQPLSVARAFGGIMPRKWGIVVQNLSGVTLDATESNHAKRYTGVYMETI